MNKNWFLGQGIFDISVGSMSILMYFIDHYISFLVAGILTTIIGMALLTLWRDMCVEEALADGVITKPSGKEE